MSTSKHTPGPWRIVRYTNYEGFSIQSVSDPMYGCVAERWEDTGRDEEREEKRLANARLIAAAPEMLDALRFVLKDAILSQGEAGYEMGGIINACEKAITKATTN